MNHSFEREQLLFDAALLLSLAERGAFLAMECGEDSQLRQRIEALLKSHGDTSGILEQPALAQTDCKTFPKPSEREKPGDRIDRYKLLEQIGEGGCGVVYLAEQEAPVRRQVALKVIKLGMDTKQVVARFEAERQALAMMDHANIAKVLDAGATEAGRPFFVMELVRGIKITEYCDQENLSTRQRLLLFVRVCQAIQHAHQKGIIHRDIKPSNILVTLNDGQPTPKVIDFGIAKATTGQRLTDQTLFTALEQFLGTPAYMSPEQAQMSSLDIDTRSDIYSLGVLLYELLTGKTPFDSKALLQAGLDVLRRTVQETEPQRPSTKLSTMLDAELAGTARRRQTEPLRLVSLIRGDLDWIVMKCLEKDRSRRYETANGLALDVQRQLQHEPVAARPPANLYRARKLFQRHKLALLAASAVLVTLVLGLVSSTVLFLREAQDNKRARAAEADATEKLHGSYLTQAQAGRWSKRAGRRFSGLDLLGKASAIRPSPELRNEAIACLTLTDLRKVKEVDFDDLNQRQCGCFDANFERFAFVDAEARVGIRRIVGGEPLRWFPGFQFPFWFMQFSPNGRFLFIAYGPNRDRIAVLDSDTGNPLFRLSESMFRTADFSLDSHLVAISYESATNHWPIRIFDLETSKSVAWFDHGSLPWYVRFNPTRPNLLLTSDQSQRVRVWDWNKGTTVTQFDHPDGVIGICWGPDGNSLASACLDAKVRLWNITEQKPRAELSGHDRAAVFVNFTDDGALLLSRGYDGKAILWDILGQREVTSMSSTFLEPFNPIGCKFATAIGKGTYAIIEVVNGCGYRIIRTEESAGSVASCDFTPGGELLLSAHLSELNLWNTSTGRKIGSIPAPSGGCFALFHPQSSNVLVSATNAILKWSMAGPLSENKSAPRLQSSWPGNRVKTILAFNQRGDRLATSSEGTALVMDAEKGSVLMQTPRYNYEFVTLSADGHLVAAWSTMQDSWQAGTNVYVWDIARTNLLHVVPAAPCIFASFSPNNQWLAVGDEANIRTWDTHSWRLLHKLSREYAGFFGFLAFSPDSTILAVAISRSTIQLCEAASGRELATLEAPERLEITWITFGPDGTQLAVGCSTGAIQLWDLRQLRQELARVNLDLDLSPFPPPNPARQSPRTPF